ncbi:MAG: hypothetical protein ACHQZR_04095 [Candidatus Limnocylindrales bacterium]
MSAPCPGPGRPVRSKTLSDPVADLRAILAAGITELDGFPESQHLLREKGAIVLDHIAGRPERIADMIHAARYEPTVQPVPDPVWLAFMILDLLLGGLGAPDGGWWPGSTPLMPPVRSVTLDDLRRTWREWPEADR